MPRRWRRYRCLRHFAQMSILMLLLDEAADYSRRQPSNACFQPIDDRRAFKESRSDAPIQHGRQVARIAFELIHFR